MRSALSTVRGHALDAGQQRVWQRLVGMCEDLARGAAPRGLYIHGTVGSGKTMLMDAFYAGLGGHSPAPAAATGDWRHREHWTPFLRRLLRYEQSPAAAAGSGIGGLDALLSGRSNLEAGALEVRRRHRVLCLDEMQLLDVADARAASTVLCTLLGRRWFGPRPPLLVMTSNLAPTELYTRGDAFGEGLRALLAAVDVAELSGAVDYRRGGARHGRGWLHPADAATHAAVDAIARAHSDSAASATICVDRRETAVGRRWGTCVVAPFEALCGRALGPGDYAALLDGGTEHIVLTDVPVLQPESADAARRLVLLVDAVYDRWPAVRLTVQAAVPSPGAVLRAEVFDDPRERRIVRRTVSRLMEMTGAR